MKNSILALLLLAIVLGSEAQRRPHPNGRGYRRGDPAAAFRNRKGPGPNVRFFDPRKTGGPFKPQRRKPFKPFIDRQFRVPNQKPSSLEFDLIAPPPPKKQEQRFSPSAPPPQQVQSEVNQELTRPRRQPDSFNVSPVKVNNIPPPIQEVPVPQYQPSPSTPVGDVAESRDTYFIPNREPVSYEDNREPVSYEDNSVTPPEQKDLERAIVGQADAYEAENKQAQVYQKEDRLEFQIHGHEGPNSYRYGYDTGHGYNRQFRYEEKDKDGMVHGRYGYFDPYGKLHVVNYSSHPEHGYKASGDGLPTR